MDPRTPQSWGVGGLASSPQTPKVGASNPPNLGGWGVSKPCGFTKSGPPTPQGWGVGGWGIGAPQPPKLGPPTPQSWGVGGFQSGHQPPKLGPPTGLGCFKALCFHDIWESCDPLPINPCVCRSSFDLFGFNRGSATMLNP